MVPDMDLNSTPFILPFEGVFPRLASPPRILGARVSLIGRITIGNAPVFAAAAVLRADGNTIRIGDDFYLGARGTVHIAHGTYPTVIGDNVAAGEDAVIHACTVANDCVIGAHSIILDGSTIGDGAILAAGSVVYPRSTLAAGMYHAGAPARAIRKTRPGEAALARERLIAEAIAPTAPGAPLATPEFSKNFVARTARASGAVHLAPAASVFFACDLDAAAHAIHIGARTNIQDNTRIRAETGAVRIGARTTLGHNVRAEDCTIGADTLIGIGSHVSPKTVIDSDVLLAAGAVTEAGQHLAGGWLWGGNPARPIAELNEARRMMMTETIAQYCNYGNAFRALQKSLHL